MNRLKTKKVYAYLLVCMLLVSLVHEHDVCAASKYRLNRKKINLLVKESFLLKVHGAKKKVKWKSSNKKIVSVVSKGKAKGKIKAKKVGKCKVYAQIGKKKLTCNVKVKKGTTKKLPGQKPAVSQKPTIEPILVPTLTPSMTPTDSPIPEPAKEPPKEEPAVSAAPTQAVIPTAVPAPTQAVTPTAVPALTPTLAPTDSPIPEPDKEPPKEEPAVSAAPTQAVIPTAVPAPTQAVTPTAVPALTPTLTPTDSPIPGPTKEPENEENQNPDVSVYSGLYDEDMKLIKAWDDMLADEDVDVYQENGEYIIGNYACKITGILYVPQTISAIAEYAFYKSETLQGIVLQDGTLDIGKNAFEGCKLLEKVEFGCSLETIGINAFSGCEKLLEIKFRGDKLAEIKEGTFSECASLTGIIIPSGVSYIGLSAFDGCVSLKEIVIPESVTCIDAFAFADCRGAETVYVPASVEEIGELAFLNVAHIEYHGMIADEAEETDMWGAASMN